MKIKTITCHDVYNVGASLQAYALMKYLQLLGHDVEIIDYKPDYLSGHYRLWGCTSPKFDKPIIRNLYSLAKLPTRLRAYFGNKRKNFDTFKSEYLNCTKKRYVSFEELQEDPPKADVYFAGSDQIWNTIFKNGRDPAFYLDFVPHDSIRASYAASFATKDIALEYHSQILIWLAKFDYISVRESSGLFILNELGIKNGVQVLDPVFLLESKDWDKICLEQEFSEKYILVYDFDDNEKIVEFAKKLAKEKNAKIYSVFKAKYADKIFENTGPQEFISLIKNAEYVISNSFHATAFSIIYKKTFAVFDRNENINTRMRDLIQMFNLKQCNNLIDSVKLEEKMNLYRKASFDFIDLVLKEVK